MDISKIVDFKHGLRSLIKVPLYNNALYLIINSGVTSGLGFFFWIVVARFYDQAVVGFSSAVISAINLLAIISLVGFNALLVRRLPASNDQEQLINTCLTISGIISILIAGIFVAGINFWSPAIGFVREHIMFAIAFIAFTLLLTLSKLTGITFVALRRAKSTLYQDSVASLLKIPLPIILVPFLRTAGIVTSWGVAIGISLAVSFFLLLPRIHRGYRPAPAIKLHLIRDLGRYSTGNYLANLFTAGSSWLLPLMVVNVLGAESNAYFYIGWMVGGAISSIPLAISSSLFAESSHFVNQMKKNVIRSIKFNLALLVPVVVLLVLAGKWLLLVFGESYSTNSLRLLQIMVISTLPLSINLIYTSILRVTYRTRELVLFRGLTNVGALLASYFVMPVTGIIGIGYVWLCIQALGAIYVMLFRRHFILSGAKDSSAYSEN